MTAPLVLMKVDGDFRPLLFEADAEAIGTALFGWIDSGLTSRVVRGRKMRTLQGLFDEFAAALQFPLYFGENQDAFNECIAEMEGLPPGEGYVVTITEPDQVLADDSSDAFVWFTRSLASAAEVWSHPVELDEWWDRAAIPFHVVLAGTGEVIAAAERRWASAGVKTVPLG